MEVTQVQSNTPAANKNSGTLRKWLRAAFLGLVGAGVVGNGYWAYETQQNQTQEVATLNSELTKNRSTINELHEAQQNQTQKVAALNSELTKNRSVIDELNKLLRHEQSINQFQARQMSDLNTNLNSRITLDQMTGAIDMVKPSTAFIQGEREQIHPFTGETVKVPYTGSGVVLIGENGQRYLLTCGHVTEGNEIKRNEAKDNVYHAVMYSGSDKAKANEFDATPVVLSNGKRAHSTPSEHDLSLLAIPPDVKLPQNTGVKLRDLNKHPLRVGEPVIVIGAPIGIKDTVTIGSISHVDRILDGVNKNHHIQIDAPANPGNSGGGVFTVRVENGKPVVELVSIVNWGYRGFDGLAMSIRVDKIQDNLKSWGITLAK